MHLSGHFKKFSRSCVLWGDLAPVLSVYTADSISGIVPRVLLAVYFDTFNAESHKSETVSKSDSPRTPPQFNTSSLILGPV